MLCADRYRDGTIDSVMVRDLQDTYITSVASIYVRRVCLNSSSARFMAACYMKRNTDRSCSAIKQNLVVTTSDYHSFRIDNHRNRLLVLHNLHSKTHQYGAKHLMRQSCHYPMDKPRSHDLLLLYGRIFWENQNCIQQYAVLVLGKGGFEDEWESTIALCDELGFLV